MPFPCGRSLAASAIRDERVHPQAAAQIAGTEQIKLRTSVPAGWTLYPPHPKRIHRS